MLNLKRLLNKITRTQLETAKVRTPERARVPY